MAWKTKKLQELEQVFKADDTLDHDWSITRRVDEEAVPPKQYARELCRTKHYVKDGVAATFPITLTLADVRWIRAHGDKIEAALKPTPKGAAKPAPAAPAADAASDSIEEVPF
jgi:hypothetical protein